MTSGAPRWGGFGCKCARHQGGPSGVLSADVFCEFLSLFWVVGMVMLLVQMSRAASNVMIAGIYLWC